MEDTTSLWDHLARRLPPDTVMVGTADHGHCDIPPGGKNTLSWDLTERLGCWGDGRVLMFNGPAEQARLIAEQTNSRYVDAQLLRRWLGGGPPHPTRRPPNRRAASARTHSDLPRLPRGGDMVGHHGGITPHFELT